MLGDKKITSDQEKLLCAKLVGHVIERKLHLIVDGNKQSKVAWEKYMQDMFHQDNQGIEGPLAMHKEWSCNDAYIKMRSLVVKAS